jgi:hypothetical protein
MKRIITVIISALAISGCVSTDHIWVENVDGNQLKIMEKHTASHRVIHIENTNRVWTGSLAGGEEHVERRKTFLNDLGKKESAKICAPNEPSYMDTNFLMIEDDAMAYGGGLIGYAIASAAADYKNLPTAAFYLYTCPQDKKEQ